MHTQILFLDLSRIPEDLKIALKKKFTEMLKKRVFSAGEEVELLETNLGNYSIN